MDVYEALFHLQSYYGNNLASHLVWLLGRIRTGPAREYTEWDLDAVQNRSIRALVEVINQAYVSGGWVQ
jgi:hypothetical protein